MRVIWDDLEKFNYDEEMVFLITDLKTYHLVKCFLIVKNITYKDEFLSDDESFDCLYKCYKNDPSDENFLKVLSHPMCKEKEKFVEIEKNFSFPKTSFEHFSLSKKESDSSVKYKLLLAKDNENRREIQNKNVYKINFNFLQ